MLCCCTAVVLRCEMTTTISIMIYLVLNIELTSSTGEESSGAMSSREVSRAMPCTALARRFLTKLNSSNAMESGDVKTNTNIHLLCRAYNSISGFLGSLFTFFFLRIPVRLPPYICGFSSNLQCGKRESKIRRRSPSYLYDVRNKGVLHPTSDKNSRRVQDWEYIAAPIYIWWCLQPWICYYTINKYHTKNTILLYS